MDIACCVSVIPRPTITYVSSHFWEVGLVSGHSSYLGSQHLYGGKILTSASITNKKTQVKSKANVVQIELKPDGKKLKVEDKLYESLSSNDVVEVIGMYKPTDKKSSSNYWFAEIKKQLLKSDAGIISRADLSSEGRQLVDGVWVKAKDTAKQEEGIINPSETFIKNVKNKIKC